MEQQPDPPLAWNRHLGPGWGQPAPGVSSVMWTKCTCTHGHPTCHQEPHNRHTGQDGKRSYPAPARKKALPSGDRGSPVVGAPAVRSRVSTCQSWQRERKGLLPLQIPDSPLTTWIRFLELMFCHWLFALRTICYRVCKWWFFHFHFFFNNFHQFHWGVK